MQRMRRVRADRVEFARHPAEEPIVHQGHQQCLLGQPGGQGVDYATRIGHLSGSQAGGRNGTFHLNATTVAPDSGAIDQLFGGDGRDWFLVSAEDVVQDLNSGGRETRTVI